MARGPHSARSGLPSPDPDYSTDVFFLLVSLDAERMRKRGGRSSGRLGCAQGSGAGPSTCGRVPGACSQWIKHLSSVGLRLKGGLLEAEAHLAEA